MYIGKLAELTGATPKAIRLYESLGLIPMPRRQGTYRVYADKDVLLVKMIRRAQSVGFTLVELRELVALKATSDRFPIEVATQLIADKREEMNKSMNELKARAQRLSALEDELNQNFR